MSSDNIGIYNDNNVIEICYNGATDIEYIDQEIRFMYEGAPRRVSTLKNNHIIVDSIIELTEGMDVSDVLQYDKKSMYKPKSVSKLQEDLRTMQETLNFLLGL